jgi:hypothetical protein
MVMLGLPLPVVARARVSVPAPPLMLSSALKVELAPSVPPA